MLALLTHVQDRFASTQVGLHRQGLAPWQLRRAKELIAGHLAEGVSVARLAEECGLSRSYFTKAFKVQHRCFAPRMADAHARRPGQGADAGQRRTAFADRRRLRLSDQPHFSRIFLRLAGASPSTWRRVKRQRTDAAL